MSQTLTPENKGPKTIQQYLEDPKVKQQIKVCLPGHLQADRVSRIALAEIRRNPFLAKCNALSLLKSVVQASTLGLEIGNNLGHAYLVPFKDEVTLIVGYKGLIDLARRSGQIVSIAAYPVYENDLFEFEFGLDEKLKHIPAKDNRGAIIAFYAYAKLQGGGYQMEVLWRSEVDAIRDSSANYRWAKQKGKTTIWDDHYVEMGRKTLIRRIAKYLPMSIELQKAAAMDEKHEAGVTDDDDFIDLNINEFKIVEEEGEAQTKSDKLAENL
jgi:recombination protein RecT